MNRRSMLKATSNAAAITILGGIPLSSATEAFVHHIEPLKLD